MTIEVRPCAAVVPGRTIHSPGAAPHSTPGLPSVVLVGPAPTMPSGPHQARLKRSSARVTLSRYRLPGAVQSPDWKGQYSHLGGMGSTVTC